jgi:hypothetical protein
MPKLLFLLAMWGLISMKLMCGNKTKIFLTKIKIIDDFLSSFAASGDFCDESCEIANFANILSRFESFSSFLSNQSFPQANFEGFPCRKLNRTPIKVIHTLS